MIPGIGTEWISALLKDGNLSSDRLALALQHVVSHSELSHLPLDRQPDWFRVWENLRYQLSGDEFSLQGPRITTPMPRVRVASVMRLETFIRRFAGPQSSYSLSSQDMVEVRSRLLAGRLSIDEQSAWSRTGVNWATFDHEIDGLDAAEVAKALGRRSFLSNAVSLVSVSYDIDSDQLHIPTVLDARLDPEFVSKAQGFSRAWDWHRGRWGASEIVHSSRARMLNPSVKFLGSIQPDQDGSGLHACAIGDSPRTRDALNRVLGRVVAHSRLRPFADGANEILDLTEREFEHFVGLLYERSGFDVEVTPATRDGGIDVIAVRNGNEGVLVQAKHTKGKVGIGVIRELIGARFFAGEDYSQYVLAVVTTGRFSRDAQRACQRFPAQITLTDYKALTHRMDELRNVGISDLVQETIRLRESTAEADER